MNKLPRKGTRAMAYLILAAIAPLGAGNIAGGFACAAQWQRYRERAVAVEAVVMGYSEGRNSDESDLAYISYRVNGAEYKGKVPARRARRLRVARRAGAAQL